MTHEILQYGALGLLFVVLVGLGVAFRMVAPWIADIGKGLVSELRANTDATRTVAESMKLLNAAIEASSKRVTERISLFEARVQGTISDLKKDK